MAQLLNHYVPDHSKLTPPPKPEGKTAHMRVKTPINGRHMTPYGESGAIFWETPTKARELIDSGFYELMNQPIAGVPLKTIDPALLLQHREGWPLDRFSAVQKIWTDETVVCIAGGPSLTAEQCNAVREAGCKIIAINDAYRLAPFADVCYFADSRWWEWHKDRADFKAFAGQRCTIFTTGMLVEDPDVHFLRNGGREGLCSEPWQIATGQNSGYQALNIAVHSGTKKIIMLGYDAQDPIPGRPNHWFGEHPTQEPATIYALYRKSMQEIAPLLKAVGVSCINCSPDSAITAFEKQPLSEALRIAR